MELNGSCAAVARTRDVCGEGVRSSSLTAAKRRAAALHETIGDLLVATAVRTSERLKLAWPKLSAATLNPLTHAIPLLLGILACFAVCTTSGIAVLSIIVVLPTSFRFWVTEIDLPPRSALPVTPDQELPMYSVIAPLRGEARVVDQLLSAIERLDYPAEKLDVILVVEADDHDTRAAITARKHRFHINVIPVPPTYPGTKPKALNVALEFARGVFTVIYDAEDRPEPNQLRRALMAFCCGGSELACVQARLCMDSRASWHARYFTAEYAGHFDIFLPKLAALRLPLPLGGSSNHFRTETLRQVGGWDPYNVTEDADLGMRLARFGYRCDVIDSTTYEEAPAKLGDWLGQRTRWFKGWMQTWLVHMRQPVQLFRVLGPRGFLTFQLVVGGNAMLALVHPLFVKTIALEFIALIVEDYDLANVIRIVYFLAIVAAGYSFSMYLGWRGLSYRKVPKKFRVLAYTPAHWMLLSCAAWWAAFELVYAPFRWNKTEHGLEMTNLLLKLNHHLTDLVKRGELPQIWGDVRDGAASRQQPLLAAV